MKEDCCHTTNSRSKENSNSNHMQKSDNINLFDVDLNMLKEIFDRLDGDDKGNAIDSSKIC